MGERFAASTKDWPRRPRAGVVHGVRRSESVARVLVAIGVVVAVSGCAQFVDLLDQPQRVAWAGQNALLGEAGGAVEQPHSALGCAPAILVDRAGWLAHCLDHLQAQG